MIPMYNYFSCCYSNYITEKTTRAKNKNRNGVCLSDAFEKLERPHQGEAVKCVHKTSVLAFSHRAPAETALP